MKTIEDYLQIAFSLGQIAGAAEAIEEQYPRDSIYGTARSLFDGTLEEALEEENQRKAEVRELQKRAVAEAVGLTMLDYRPAPDDVIVQRADGTPAQDYQASRRWTHFCDITETPEKLAEFMMSEEDRCPPHVVSAECNETSDCIKCWLDWLNAEVKA